MPNTSYLNKMDPVWRQDHAPVMSDIKFMIDPLYSVRYAFVTKNHAYTSTDISIAALVEMSEKDPRAEVREAARARAMEEIHALRSTDEFKSVPDPDIPENMAIRDTADDDKTVFYYNHQSHETWDLVDGWKLLDHDSEGFATPDYAGAIDKAINAWTTERFESYKGSSFLKSSFPGYPEMVEDIDAREMALALKRIAESSQDQDILELLSRCEFAEVADLAAEHLAVLNGAPQADKDSPQLTKERVSNMEEKKEYVNIEMPASKVFRHENSQTGDQFSKCYFPDGVTIDGQDLTGYYLQPKPEFIKPSRSHIGAMRWGYENNPDKKVWAFIDLKNEDGEYTGERTHVEIEPAKIEEAMREWMRDDANKEFVAIDVSRVHERVNSETGNRFYSIQGPKCPVDGKDLSGYNWTANYITPEFNRSGETQKMVGVSIVKGESIRMTPPPAKEGEEQKPVAYAKASEVAKSYNVDHKRIVEHAGGGKEPAHAKDKAAPAKSEPAKTVEPVTVQNAPKTPSR